MVVIDESDYLAHYGVLRRSGRYPWGSGDNQNTRNQMFVDYLSEMRSKGLKDVDIAKGVGMSLTQLRAVNSIAKNQIKQADINMAQRLKDKGYANTEIGRRMGKPESSVRALLAPGAQAKSDMLINTADMLKRHVDEKGLIDIGSGVENYLGVSKEGLNAAVAVLREQGYTTHRVKHPQIATGLDTEMKIIAPPGTTQREVFLNRDKIKQIAEYSDDGGVTFGRFHDPISIHPDRVAVRYGDEGGDATDGVIYVRPGVKDVSIGNARYAQVRVKVGDGHFLKGMAMYKEDLPDGVDLMFNTNKKSTGHKLDAMKKLSDDKELPFESVVRQILSDQGTPTEKVTSAMNIVGTKPGSGEEGSWKNWSRNLSSQFLSKQSPTLARTQLNATYADRKQEFDEINSLTNPTVKKKLLDSFADGTDAAAVHLKAASLPRQNWHVILPIDSINPKEVYAPTYDNGERVVLIRYPHGGTFEIPELIVNNRHPESRRVLGDAKDAIGIHHSVAERLSGADFDGDTVLVIPNNQSKVKTTPALEGLKGFNAKTAYPRYEGMPKLSDDRKQQLMGDISNLITDMTIKNASHEQLSRAVRHSMVVIDAKNHDLNYRQSAIDFGIPKLKAEYQGSSKSGASTLLSRKKKEDYLPERKLRLQAQGGPIDPVTGRRVYVETGRTRSTPDGPVIVEKKYKQLDLADDAHDLSSGTPMEKLYADHSNRLKELANQARLSSIKTPLLKHSPSAKKAYAKEVTSLNAKLALVQKNRPLERQAQVIAAAQVKARRAANPNLDGDTLKKVKFKALEEARARTGAKRHEIRIEDEEWNAIQAGAISDHKLSQILDRSDLDRVRELATPRVKLLMTPAKMSTARALAESGYTRAEIAKRLGVSLTTLEKSMTSEGGE